MILQSTPQHVSRGKHDPKEFMHCHCSTVFNSQVMETNKCPLKEEQIKIRYTYTTEYHSAIKKNKIMSFAATWMNIEIALLS